MKPIDDAFADWEGSVFGYGYGTGEEHILGALVAFMEQIKDGRSYDYRDLEVACGATVAWLLINALCHADIIEYGSSPRFGWLTPQGGLLCDYICSKTASELYQIISDRSTEYIGCGADYCNCGSGPTDGACQNNPFFRGE